MMLAISDFSSSQSKPIWCKHLVAKNGADEVPYVMVQNWYSLMSESGEFIERFVVNLDLPDQLKYTDTFVIYTPPKKYSSTWDISCPKTYIKCNFMKWILASHDL